MSDDTEETRAVPPDADYEVGSPAHQEYLDARRGKTDPDAKVYDQELDDDPGEYENEARFHYIDDGRPLWARRVERAYDQMVRDGAEPGMTTHRLASSAALALSDVTNGERISQQPGFNFGFGAWVVAIIAAALIFSGVTNWHDSDNKKDEYIACVQSGLPTPLHSVQDCKK